ncbi:hypothetical protein [Klenkia taihuensis]|uniref:hypothetical protein n=1 Tax=Klenkia taihuensis TaxID=1225127 RepID=UPI0013F5E9A5|nr:hypothetical protein [Klenkia taihuensis]
MPSCLPVRVLGSLVLAASVVLVPVPAQADVALVPGAQWSTTVDLPDAWASRADQLAVSVASLDQQENGCLRPELAAGDTSCDDDGGDLASMVSAAVAAGRYEGGSCVPATAAQPLDLMGSGAARVDILGPECLVLTIDFPGGPDDDLAQSDALDISLFLVAGGPGAEVGAAAPPVVATGPGQLSSGVASPVEAGNGDASTVAGGPGGTSRVVGGAAPGAVTDRSATGSVERPVGEATADVSVGAEGTDVQSESAERLLDDPLALAALLLGTTVLLWLLFLVLRRRRGERA